MNECIDEWKIKIPLLYSDVHSAVSYFLGRKAWLLLHLGCIVIILQMY